MATHAVHNHDPLPTQGSFVPCGRDDLEPGGLNRVFLNGAKAVILQNDDRVRQIWEGLLGINPNHESASYNGGMHPWTNNILDIARNHHSRDTSMGDVFRFIPGFTGQISRKFMIFPESPNTMKTIPENFFIGSQKLVFPQDALKTVWELMSDVLHSTLPVNTRPPPYAIKIEMIKYPNSKEEVAGIASLLIDGFGNLVHLGYRLEIERCKAVGFFDIKGIRLLFALASLLPGINILCAKLNSFMKRFSNKKVPEGAHMILPPHIDDGRVITALIGDRVAVRTEMYDGKHWLELPVSSTSLAIFPSRNCRQQTTIPPSLHRVLVKDQENPPFGEKPNISISLGVIPHPAGR